MLMDVGLDTGDMLLTNKVEVTPDMTSGELYEILKVTGADLLINTINELAQGNIKPKKQEKTFKNKGFFVVITLFDRL